MPDSPTSPTSPGEPWADRREIGQAETVAANRAWWDAEAADYHAEHGDFLGDVDFVWGPEGWTEDELGLLGLPGLQGLKDPRDEAGDRIRVLEIGGGAGQCARWIQRTQPDVEVVSTDLSGGMVRVGRAINERHGIPLPLAQCDAAALPFAGETFDVVFTAYGAVPFVADSAGLLREVCRVLRPGGRFVFSTTHPIRWAFPDVPGEHGLTATMSYFDRTPYAEGAGGDNGPVVTYAEHHRTIGDRVREVIAAGLSIVDLVEPEWPERNRNTWGGWWPLRGGLLPGTAIFVTERAP